MVNITIAIFLNNEKHGTHYFDWSKNWQTRIYHQQCGGREHLDFNFFCFENKSSVVHQVDYEGGVNFDYWGGEFGYWLTNCKKLVRPLWWGFEATSLN